MTAFGGGFSGVPDALRSAGVRISDRSGPRGNVVIGLEIWHILFNGSMLSSFAPNKLRRLFLDAPSIEMIGSANAISAFSVCLL